MRNFLGKVLSAALAALAAVCAIAAAVWMHSSFMILEMEGISMLPFVKPGQKVLVTTLNCDNPEVGDLIVCQSPFYDVDGQGPFEIRLVTGIKNTKVETGAGSLAAAGITAVIDKEDIVGKVIYYGKERTQTGSEQ